MADFLAALATWPVLIVSGVATVGLMWWIQSDPFPYRGSSPYSITDLQQASSVPAFSQVLESWLSDGGPDALANFKRLIVVSDFFFPAAYGTFMTGILAWIWAPFETDPELLIVAVPLLAAVADIAENLLHLWLIPDEGPLLLDESHELPILAASLFARVKLALFFVGFPLLVLAGVLI